MRVPLARLDRQARRVTVRDDGSRPLLLMPEIHPGEREILVLVFHFDVSTLRFSR